MGCCGSQPPPPPQDVVCPGCGRKYKAAQMAQHKPLCASISAARKQLPGCRPVLGVEITEGMQVVSVKAGGPLDGLGVKEDDVMVSFAGVETKAKQDFTDALKLQRPGDEVAVSFRPKGGGDPVAGNAVLQTTIPLDAYRKLVRLVQDDDRMTGVSTDVSYRDGDLLALSTSTRKVASPKGGAVTSSAASRGGAATPSPKSGGKPAGKKGGK